MLRKSCIVKRRQFSAFAWHRTKLHRFPPEIRYCIILNGVLDSDETENRGTISKTQGRNSHLQPGLPVKGKPAADI